jgi:hypothetical protein
VPTSTADNAKIVDNPLQQYDSSNPRELSFAAPWFLRSGHLQTILTALHRPKAQLPNSQRGEVPIGPRGSTYVYRNQPDSYRDPVNGPSEAFILLHGLGSSHAGSYMTGICGELLRQGYQTVRIDTPGAGTSFELTDLPPHAGSSEFILRALTWVAEHWHIERFRLVGFSLGGNIALHLGSVYSDELASLSAAGIFNIESIHALAPPIDLAHCCTNMERGLNRIYAAYFLKGLRKAAEIRAQRWDSWRDRQQGFQAKSIRSFDEQVTAPMAGFSGAAEYYAYSSVHQRLHQLQIPTTILVDQHDPIVPYSIFQQLDFKSLPFVTMLTTRRGGHLGYYHYLRGKGLKRWADEAVTANILAAITRYSSKCG